MINAPSSNSGMNRLVIVSSQALLCASVQRVVHGSVCVVRYDYERASLFDLSELVSSRLGGCHVKSIALVFHCDHHSFFLTLDSNKALNLATLNNDADIQQLLINLSSHLDEGEGLHLFNSPRNLDSRAFTAQLRQLLGHHAELVSDLFWPVSQQYITELYFNIDELQKLLYPSVSKINAVDGYEKVRTVGKGAFGTAFLYRKTASDQLVVIKEIDMIALTATERKMALNEVQVLSSLHHPNIVRYLGSFEADGILRIEMEFADGGTLAQLIAKSSRLSELEVLTLFRQCVAAIRYMHHNNILHRDLKTANVFLTKDRVIKVGDFGISKIMSTKGQAQTVLGTPYYISPEMCEGKQYDHKSDVWALGCILYEMACLQKTFQGDNLPVLVNKIMKGTFDPVPGVYSEGLRNLVSTLLQREPTLRPTAVETYDTITSLLEQFQKSRAWPEGKKRKLRSILYQLSGSGPSFSCVPVGLPATLKVTQVSASSTHYVAVMSDKTVFTWGEGKRGQLGHDEAPIWLQQPTLVRALANVQIISAGAGDGFSVFLSESSLVFTCGDGMFGCLGHGEWGGIQEPRVVESLMGVEVRQVACGENHCIALANDGGLFAWGRGESGRLGTGDQCDRWLPTPVPFPVRDVSSVHCGPDCTAIVTADGTVFACGNNVHNKLGLSSSVLRVVSFNRITVRLSTTFREVRSLGGWRAVSVSLAVSHSAVLTTCGRVLTMGSNAEGQTGRDGSAPGVVKSVEDKIAKSVVCGPTYTLMASIHNALYFWGTRYISGENAGEALTLKVELASEPQAVLVLYASPQQVGKGEFVIFSDIEALWNSILVLVDTTAPLVCRDCDQSGYKEEFDTLGAVPRWITAELAQAEHEWDENRASH